MFYLCFSLLFKVGLTLIKYSTDIIKGENIVLISQKKTDIEDLTESKANL